MKTVAMSSRDIRFWVAQTGTVRFDRRRTPMRKLRDAVARACCYTGFVFQTVKEHAALA